MFRCCHVIEPFGAQRSCVLILLLRGVPAPLVCGSGITSSVPLLSRCRNTLAKLVHRGKCASLNQNNVARTEQEPRPRNRACDTLTFHLQPLKPVSHGFHGGVQSNPYMCHRTCQTLPAMHPTCHGRHTSQKVNHKPQVHGYSSPFWQLPQ